MYESPHGLIAEYFSKKLNIPYVVNCQGISNGGIPETIGNGGIVVKEDDYFEKRFSEAVIELLDNTTDRDILIQRSLSHSRENIVNKELEIYEKLIK
jgi:glycosyltransferase involved in cell wall biosynthesis